MIDALPLGEIGGQHPPLDPAFGDIKNGIEHSPHAQGARASPAFGGGDQLFDPLPFFVGQVAWICFFIHTGVWRILCIAQIQYKRISAYARSATPKHTPERISSCSS